jgi:hypothetical protein
MAANERAEYAPPAKDRTECCSCCSAGTDVRS